MCFRKEKTKQNKKTPDKSHQHRWKTSMLQLLGCSQCCAGDDSHAVLCLEKRKGSKKDWLCPLSPACWARPDYVTQGCSLVQRFTRRLWNLLWQLPETKIYLRNTQLPQFLSPATKHIGSLYIIYWHQEFQLLHMQPILVIGKSTDEGRSLCFPMFKKKNTNHTHKKPPQKKPKTKTPMVSRYFLRYYPNQSPGLTLHFLPSHIFVPSTTFSQSSLVKYFFLQNPIHTDQKYSKTLSFEWGRSSRPSIWIYACKTYFFFF